jgi:hypothetical protein
MAARFEAWQEALAAEAPLKALSDVARQRVAEGTERDDLIAELQEFLDVLYEEDREADADTVLEVMDFIVGYCAPGMQI